MIINGNDAKNWGILVVASQGFFDMPSRANPFFYDWGDEIQPLVDEKDLFWKSMTFVVDCIYDQRITGNSFDQTMDALKALEEFQLEQSFASGGNGVFTVKMDSAIKVKQAGPLVKFSMVFFNRVPEFTGSVPAPSDSGTSIGGFSFSQFGLILSSKEDFISLASLKASKETTYMSDPKKSLVRGLNEITLNCWIVGNDQTDLIKKLSEFRTMLASPGLKVLKYGGYTKNVFLSSGFKVDVRGKRAARFNLKLNEV